MTISLTIVRIYLSLEFMLFLSINKLIEIYLKYIILVQRFVQFWYNRIRVTIRLISIECVQHILSSYRVSFRFEFVRFEVFHNTYHHQKEVYIDLRGLLNIYRHWFYLIVVCSFDLKKETIVQRKNQDKKMLKDKTM